MITKKNYLILFLCFNFLTRLDAGFQDSLSGSNKYIVTGSVVSLGIIGLILKKLFSIISNLQEELKKLNESDKDKFKLINENSKNIADNKKELTDKLSGLKTEYESALNNAKLELSNEYKFLINNKNEEFINKHNDLDQEIKKLNQLSANVGELDYKVNNFYDSLDKYNKSQAENIEGRLQFLDSLKSESERHGEELKQIKVLSDELTKLNESIEFIKKSVSDNEEGNKKRYDKINEVDRRCYDLGNSLANTDDNIKNIFEKKNNAMPKISLEKIIEICFGNEKDFEQLKKFTPEELVEDYKRKSIEDLVEITNIYDQKYSKKDTFNAIYNFSVNANYIDFIKEVDCLCELIFVCILESDISHRKNTNLITLYNKEPNKKETVARFIESRISLKNRINREHQNFFVTSERAKDPFDECQKGFINNY